MTRLLSTLIALLLLSTNAFATPNTSFLRDLTIETMLKYAQELYQRGDVVEARNVMARIKQLSPEYLTPKRGKKTYKKPAAASCCMAYTSSANKADKAPQYVAVTADLNDDLKQAIAKEDKILRELNRDVDDLRLQIQATHHE